MGSLYLDRKNLALKLDGQALALYENDEKKGTVPLHLVDRVILRGMPYIGAVHLQTLILQRLTIYCSIYHPSILRTTWIIPHQSDAGTTG